MSLSSEEKLQCSNKTIFYSLWTLLCCSTYGGIIGLCVSVSVSVLVCICVYFKYLKNLEILENSSSILKRKMNIKSDWVILLHLELLTCFCIDLGVLICCTSQPWLQGRVITFWRILMPEHYPQGFWGKWYGTWTFWNLKVLQEFLVCSQGWNPLPYVFVTDESLLCHVLPR